MRASRAFRRAFSLILPLLGACSPGSPQVGSQTNWLKSCETTEECGELSCLCGMCTLSCESSVDCWSAGAASCVASTDEGAIAACDGSPKIAGICLPSCDESSCPIGTSCVAGVCSASREATAYVFLDPSTKYQTLIGFGAAIAYDEERIVQHPDKGSLFDLMFSEGGFEVIRFRNRFEEGNLDAPDPEREIILQATLRLGRAPTLFMTSTSPPAALKANGQKNCNSSDVNCTLVRAADGGFDYAGFAEYWRASLAAYENVGIHPDFVSIQNNADFIPSDEIGIDACRFLPQEGTTSITTPDGETVEGEFAGYDQALEAVSMAVGSLPNQYSFTGPEVGSAIMGPRYRDSLSAADSFSFHLYLMDPSNVRVDQLEAIALVAEELNIPILQSEMSAGGLATAILAHYTLVYGGASAYLQQKFVSPTTAEDSHALISMDGETIEPTPAYHALAHFSRSTEPGWRRIAATSDSTELLSSAWVAPDENALTIVLVNPSDSPIDTEILVPRSIPVSMETATITRTTFEGVERSANLGRIPQDRIVRVPQKSIVTIAATDD